MSTLLEQPRTNAGRPLNLPGNQAHLWCFSLSLLPGEEERIWEWLSEDERKRAERFHFRKHREHFIKARGVLRKVLAGYISTTPERVQFRYTAWGKPSLAEGEPIKFNLSHSGEKGLLGIARVEIGVDIEEIRPMAEREAVARGFFSEREVTAFERVAEEEKNEAFYRIWTRKEAILKGWGCGITENLKRFSVSVEADPAGEILEECAVELREQWRIHGVRCAGGYAAAVAINSLEVEPVVWGNGSLGLV